VRSWTKAGGVALAILALGGLQEIRADEVPLRALSGAKIDANWFRYVNLRFGLAVDIPTKGYVYDIPVNGSGLALISINRAVTITLYTHWVVNIFETANNDVQRTITQLFDSSVAETLQKNGTVEYSVKKDDFYVLSGRFAENTYYERVTVSSKCPAIFSSLRIFYPHALEERLDQLVTRMSKSLSSTCKGDEGAASF
jgi:hypothetical protein